MLAIIGGSGFYDFPGVKTSTALDCQTPFGDASSPVSLLEFDNGARALFLSRHGPGHALLPSEINYRANIWALKKAGARQVVAVSACGSLREEIAPGDFIVPSQYFDHTRGARVRSFFGNGLIGHISSAHPACPVLSRALMEVCESNKFRAHGDKTYACVEGPRLGTRAESFFLRDSARADIVGMTNVPEVFLAMEAQLCYVTLAVCTDYDCWMDDPAHHATVETIIARFGESIARARDVVLALLQNPPPVNEKHRMQASGAIMTPPDFRSEEHNKLLEVLLA